jgi:hypothetical protein
VAPDVVDKAAALELDADSPTEPNSEPNRGRRRSRGKRADLGLVPDFAPVLLQHAGKAPWSPLILMETATKAPAIEVTADNLGRLLELIVEDLQDGAVKRVKHGVDRQGPAPRGNKGDREYFVRNRWVRKTRLDPKTGCGFRTLIRIYRAAGLGRGVVETSEPRPCS